MFNFRAKYSDEQKKTEIPGNEYIYLDQQPEFKTKWTKANSGQAKLQGILPEGLSTFIKYRERCTKGRFMNGVFLLNAMFWNAMFWRLFA